MPVGFGDDLTTRIKAIIAKTFPAIIGLTPGQYSNPTLTVGADGRVTRIAAGSGGGGGTLGGAKAHHNSNQSIANLTQTTLAWNTEDDDTDGYHDNTTNNTRLTIPASGLYLFGAEIKWAVNATGYRQIVIRATSGMSSTDVARENRMANTTAFQDTTHEIIGRVNLAAGDYIEALVTQSSGGSLNVTGTTSSFFWIERLR